MEGDGRCKKVGILGLDERRDVCEFIQEITRNGLTGATETITTLAKDIAAKVNVSM